MTRDGKFSRGSIGSPEGSPSSGPSGVAAATAENVLPSRRMTNEESHFSSLTALATIASNTGLTSPSEALISRRISALAVCTASASLVSRNRRAFWMAITAWSAKVCSIASSFTENGPFARATPMAPMPRLSHSIGAKAID